MQTPEFLNTNEPCGFCGGSCHICGSTYCLNHLNGLDTCLFCRSGIGTELPRDQGVIEAIEQLALNHGMDLAEVMATVASARHAIMDWQPTEPNPNAVKVVVAEDGTEAPLPPNFADVMADYSSWLVGKKPTEVGDYVPPSVIMKSRSVGASSMYAAAALMAAEKGLSIQPSYHPGPSPGHRYPAQEYRARKAKKKAQRTARRKNRR